MTERAQIQLRVTDYQYDEISHGFDIDASDGYALYGELRAYRSGGGVLTVYGDEGAYERAFYRLTHARDIAQDNAADWPYDGAAQRARSLVSLVERFIEAIGGEEAIPASVRCWRHN